MHNASLGNAECVGIGFGMTEQTLAKQAFSTNASRAYTGFGFASLILAVEPIRWLVTTWLAPSYQSVGFLYLAALSAVAFRSLASGPATSIQTDAIVLALRLLLLAAALRLAGQIAGINVIGGVALAVDVYSIAVVLRLRERPKPASPFWLAVLFLFSLPFERIAQRVLGYPLKEISVGLACQILKRFYPDLVCSGVRLQISRTDVLSHPLHYIIGLGTTLAFIAPLLFLKDTAPMPISRAVLPARPMSVNQQRRLAKCSIFAIVIAALITTAPRQAPDTIRRFLISNRWMAEDEVVMAAVDGTYKETAFQP